MKKWEYYWYDFKFDKEHMDKIDSLGESGWEIVNIISVKQGLVDFVAILKKEAK